MVQVREADRDHNLAHEYCTKSYDGDGTIVGVLHFPLIDALRDAPSRVPQTQKKLQGADSKSTRPRSITSFLLGRLTEGLPGLIGLMTRNDTGPIHMQIRLRRMRALVREWIGFGQE